MKKITKKIAVLAFIAGLIIPNGVFASSSYSLGLPYGQPDVFSVFPVSASQPAPLEVKGAQLQAEKIVLTETTDCVSAVSRNNYFSPQFAGQINFNQPAGCFSLSLSRGYKPSVQIAVSPSLPVRAVAVVVIRNVFLSELSDFPAFPLPSASLPIFPAAQSAVCVLFFIIALPSIKRRVVKAAGKQVNLHRVMMLRC